MMDAATPRAAVSNGATRRAPHTKNKTDRETYNGCCPCGYHDSPVYLCVYIDETMRGRWCFAGSTISARGREPLRGVFMDNLPVAASPDEPSALAAEVRSCREEDGFGIAVHYGIDGGL